MSSFERSLRNDLAIPFNDAADFFISIRQPVVQEKTAAPIHARAVSAVRNATKKTTLSDAVDVAKAAAPDPHEIPGMVLGENKSASQRKVAMTPEALADAVDKGTLAGLTQSQKNIVVDRDSRGERTGRAIGNVTGTVGGALAGHKLLGGPAGALVGAAAGYAAGGSAGKEIGRGRDIARHRRAGKKQAAASPRIKEAYYNLSDNMNRATAGLPTHIDPTQAQMDLASRNYRGLGEKDIQRMHNSSAWVKENPGTNRLLHAAVGGVPLGVIGGFAGGALGGAPGAVGGAALGLLGGGALGALAAPSERTYLNHAADLQGHLDELPIEDRVRQHLMERKAQLEREHALEVARAGASNVSQNVNVSQGTQAYLNKDGPSTTKGSRSPGDHMSFHELDLKEASAHMRFKLAAMKLADGMMGGGTEDQMTAPTDTQELQPQNYLQAEMLGQQAQSSQEGTFYRQRAQQAAQQVAQVQQQVQQLQMQAEQASQQVQETMAQATQAQDEALRQTQIAANMRMGMQKLRQQMLEVASQDPAQVSAQELQNTLQPPQPAAPLSEDPSATGGAPPAGPAAPAEADKEVQQAGRAQDEAAMQTMQAEQAAGAAPPAGSPPPGAAPSPSGGADMATMEPAGVMKQGSVASLASGALDQVKQWLPTAATLRGALIGAGAGAAGNVGYQQLRGSQTEGLRSRVQQLEAQENGGFRKALQLAAAQQRLSVSEARDAHPGQAMARDAGTGALVGALGGSMGAGHVSEFMKHLKV